MHVGSALQSPSATAETPTPSPELLVTRALQSTKNASRRFIIYEAARSILKLYSALITAFRTQFKINRSPEGYSSEPERIQSPSANASKSRARPPPTGLHRPMNGDATSAWPPSCAPRSVARPSWSRRSPARHPQPEVK